MTTRILKGTWFDSGGLISDLAPREALIEITNDGTIYDARDYGRDFAVEIDACGYLRFPCHYFRPDEGELDRVGLRADTATIDMSEDRT